MVNPAALVHRPQSRSMMDLVHLLLPRVWFMSTTWSWSELGGAARDVVSVVVVGEIVVGEIVVGEIVVGEIVVGEIVVSEIVVGEVMVDVVVVSEIMVDEVKIPFSSLTGLPPAMGSPASLSSGTGARLR